VKGAAAEAAAASAPSSMTARRTRFMRAESKAEHGSIGG
jgi:hypothetical protein